MKIRPLTPKPNAPPSGPCCCPPAAPEAASASTAAAEPYRTGCMLCADELVYFETYQERICHYCGQAFPANAACAVGHFVCDACHRAGALEVIHNVCLHTRLAGPVALMQTIRAHPRFAIHGPEHHALVPAILLAALRNSGQSITDEQIQTAIQRGATISGGACAFLGVCGAAVGVGIAVSVLLGATPYRGDSRRATQQATLAAMNRIAPYDAPRCCQRDSWLALDAAARPIHDLTGIRLSVEPFACQQHELNKECIQDECPLWR